MVQCEQCSACLWPRFPYSGIPAAARGLGFPLISRRGSHWPSAFFKALMELNLLSFFSPLIFFCYCAQLIKRAEKASLCPWTSSAFLGKPTASVAEQEEWGKHTLWVAAIHNLWDFVAPSGNALPQPTWSLLWASPLRLGSQRRALVTSLPSRKRLLIITSRKENQGMDTAILKELEEEMTPSESSRNLW